MRRAPRPARPSRTTRRTAGVRPRDRGFASLEYLGMLPFLLLVALTGIQLGIVAYCNEQAGTAARTAARTAAQANPKTDPATAGRNAVSGWVNPTINPPTGDTATVTESATVRIPSVIPGISFFDPVTRSATMPKEHNTP
jgi:Flp pilus assembly protein TadG